METQDISHEDLTIDKRQKVKYKGKKTGHHAYIIIVKNDPWTTVYVVL